MDLILLDSDFNICGIVEKYSELRWNRRYFSAGDFELRLSPEYFENLRAARYIYHSENDETAIIENVRYDLDGDGRHLLYAGGRMLEALFFDRVIDKTVMLEGNIETAVNDLVMKIAMTGDRKIERLLISSTDGFDYTVSEQVTGRNLMEFLYTLLRSYGLSFSLHYDYLYDDISFQIYGGKNRSRSQSVNSVAVFSTDFENIKSDRYIFSISDYKNFAYVAGEGTGADRVVTTVDMIPEGEDRRELFVDARDVRKTLSDGTALTDAEYLLGLKSRGTEKLKSHCIVDYAECNIDSDSNLVYRKDYDIGDICDFDDPELGISSTLRITELHEIRSGGGMTVEAVFAKA